MTTSNFKLNRNQRKDFARTLQRTVLNLGIKNDGVTSSTTGGYSEEERIEAARLLADLGDDEIAVDTFNTQLKSANPEDTNVNIAIRKILAEAYKAGAKEGND
jgi:hypothetical protein